MGTNTSKQPQLGKKKSFKDLGLPILKQKKSTYKVMDIERTSDLGLLRKKCWMIPSFRMSSDYAFEIDRKNLQRTARETFRHSLRFCSKISGKCIEDIKSIRMLFSRQIRLKKLSILFVESLYLRYTIKRLIHKGLKSLSIEAYKSRLMEFNSDNFIKVISFLPRLLSCQIDIRIGSYFLERTKARAIKYHHFYNLKLLSISSSIFAVINSISFGKMKKLEALRLLFINPNVLPSFKDISQIEKIKKLELIFNKSFNQVKNADLDFCKSFTHLEKLTLYYAILPIETKDSFQFLAECKGLKELIIFFPIRLTANLSHSLELALSQLSQLNSFALNLKMFSLGLSSIGNAMNSLQINKFSISLENPCEHSSFFANLSLPLQIFVANLNLCSENFTERKTFSEFLSRSSGLLKLKMTLLYYYPMLIEYLEEPIKSLKKLQEYSVTFKNCKVSDIKTFDYFHIQTQNKPDLLLFELHLEPVLLNEEELSSFIKFLRHTKGIKNMKISILIASYVFQQYYDVVRKIKHPHRKFTLIKYQDGCSLDYYYDTDY